MPKRRSNNEGTIYEDKEKGGYRVQLTAPDGKRISKRFKDPDAAMEWKNNQLSDFSKGKYVAPKGTTLGEWLDKWLDEYILPKRKTRTYEAYKSLFDNHLKDIKNTPIQDIIPYHITKVYNAMRKKKKSETTILKLHAVLHNALKAARINKLVHVNIMEDVEKPEPGKVKDIKSDENDINRILKAMEGTRIYAGVYLLAHTGMRLGEILGLRWKDIDFEDGKITIVQNIQRTKAKKLSVETPKTEYSFRSFFVEQNILDVLSAELERQQADDNLKNSKTVVCNNLGKYLEPRRFALEFDNVRKKIGMNNVTRHSLRHAVASILIDHGVPVPEVSALLGHADQAFTFRRYVHQRKDATKKAAKAIDNALHPKKKIKRKVINKLSKSPAMQPKKDNEKADE